MRSFRIVAPLCLIGLLSISGCIAPESGSAPRYGRHDDGGGYGAGPRLYTHEGVRREWMGATMGEVQDGWGPPYLRAYGDWEYVDGEIYGYDPYMAYVWVVREPIGNQPGEVEHIFFVLTDDFGTVKEIRFGGSQPWWGEDVEVDTDHEW